MLEALKDKVFHANLELVKHGLVINDFIIYIHFCKCYTLN